MASSQSGQCCIVMQSSLENLLCNLLTADEQAQIKQQLKNECRRDSQVLWSGVPRETAEKWAGKRSLQTLSMAMGPLMDENHPSCLKSRKSTKRWGLYMKGASALFANLITQNSTVTVLLPPPPQTLNPYGNTNYQLLEEPILKGTIGGVSVGRIQTVHPTVAGAEDFQYESWPDDQTERWALRFSPVKTVRVSWRLVKIQPEVKRIIKIVAIAQKHLCDVGVASDQIEVSSSLDGAVS